MKCWSCGKKIPDDAQACRSCEAPTQPEPTAEEIDLVRGILNDVSPGLLDEFKAVFDQSLSAARREEGRTWKFHDPTPAQPDKSSP